MAYPRTPLNKVYAMYDYYRQGHSARDTAAKFGHSANTVCAAFRRAGLPVRTRLHGVILSKRLDPAETEAMYADFQAGMTKTRIGEKYLLSRTAVLYRFKKAGYAGRRTA